MRLSSFAALTLILAAMPAPAGLHAQGGGELRLDLNIPTQQIVLFEGDAELRRYPVSVGKRGHETPVGRFTIGRAEWNPSWTPPDRAWARDARPAAPGDPGNPMGRVKLFFAPLYFIHGTTDVQNLGSPASHGCVRMHNDDVVALATLLHERAGANVPASSIPGILRNRRVTRHASFQRPVELVIRYDPVVVRGDELRIYPDIYRLNRVHVEGIVQALLAAGYAADSVDRAAAERLVRSARGSTKVLSYRLPESFAGLQRAPIALGR
jgi:hypothetical protein